MVDADREHNIIRIERELNSLDVAGACLYYRNYVHSFLPSPEIIVSFMKRMSADRQAHSQPEAAVLMKHAARWWNMVQPFDADRLGVLSGFDISREVLIAQEVCRGTNAHPELYQKIQETHFSLQAQELRETATTLLHQNPMYVLAADLLLNLDAFEGRLPDPALSRFKCPKVLAPLWRLRLFRHCAALGAAEEAMRHWDESYLKRDDPHTFNLAAEVFRMLGDQPRCMELYERSLRLDLMQQPVALRLEALSNPFQPDHGLVGRKKTCIYLYSYNKCHSLAETLESLAACDIGHANIKILLNGCTDDSAIVANKALELFPENHVEIIGLPVNIGAPAARNWLISQPDTWQSDYVAFLDDDVELQPDWLAHFLTVAESDQRIANVGCKVVFPGRYRMIQYLYRYVSVANSNLVRMSFPVPDVQYDTGLYEVIRPTRVVMGCQHMMRVSALMEVPWFDIRYSPSQVDDTDHDLQFCLKGYRVAYCGSVTCVHKHNSGVSKRSGNDSDRIGNVNGNDVKFFYKYIEQVKRMIRLDSISLE